MNALRAHFGAVVLAIGISATAANAGLPSHPEVQVLHPTDADQGVGTDVYRPDAFFGKAVAVYKSTALVGMPNAPTGTVEDTGRVGVFTRKDGVWKRTGTFVSPAPREGGVFGRLVALENDGAIVADGTTLYVYKYTSSTGWKIVQWVKAPKSDGTSLSFSLDFRCNTVAAAARSDSHQFVYLYDRLADGTLAFKARLTSPTGDSTKEFGDSVAVDCNLAVVGEPASASYPSNDTGSAYVYRRTNGTWRLAQRLVSNDGAGGDQFGSAVAINQQTVFVGAPRAHREVEPGGNFAREGVTYIFSLNSGSYGITDELHPTADQNNGYGEFGRQIRATDDRLFVGAHEFQYADDGLRPENFIFTYSRSGGTASAVGLTTGVADSPDFVISGTRLFVGTPDDLRCFWCRGAVHIYDVTQTQ
jgi:hypothetical protein